MRDKLLGGLFRQLEKYKGALPESWSRMAMLARCPRQWDLRYRKGLKEQDMPAAGITDLTNTRAGKAIHWVLEKSVRSSADLGRDGTGDPVTTSSSTMYMRWKKTGACWSDWTCCANHPFRCC